MTLNEFNEVKGMTYNEYCNYLKEKYKDNPPYGDYFHLTTRGGTDPHLTKSNKISRGSEGLQCHHICEDKVASLSDVTIATKYYAEHPEYQAKENLCYCNLLEHMFLHILIAEQMTDYSDEQEGETLGLGGVQWMALALNSIYSNPDKSWYSKGAVKEVGTDINGELFEEEFKGLNYNINNIITDNKETYLALVNRFCTSAFVRQHTDYTAELLGELLCVACKKDENKLPIFDDILLECRKSMLFDWNVNCFADLLTYLKKDRTAIVNICTGGGKTTTALEYMRLFSNGKKALVLGPNGTIGDTWGKNDKGTEMTAVCDYMNYQTFMNCYKEINYRKYCVIICDECHHTDAIRWGEGLQFILDNTDLKIIGLTATLSKEQADGTDKYFKGNICYGLDLADGIKDGNIHPFSYIQSIYCMEDVKAEFDKYGAFGTELWEKLNLQLNQHPIESILKENMPQDTVRKIIVFAQCVADTKVAQECMKKYNPLFESEEYMRVITSHNDDDYNADAKRWFNTANDHDVCLVTVSMVNEGAHYDGVNTLVMFRRTNSATLYLQQLGRVVVTKSKPDPKGIVFDFTNNAAHLASMRVLNSSDAVDQNKDIVKKTAEAIKEVVAKFAGKDLIYKDYTENCVEVLKSLMTVTNRQRCDNRIFQSINAYKLDENFFDFSLWDGYKCEDNNADAKKATKAKSTSTKTEIKKALKNVGAVTHRTTNVPSSNIEKIATAYRVLVRRAFNFGILDFNPQTFAPIFKDEVALDKMILSFGFLNTKHIKENVMLNDLSKFTMTLARMLDE